MQHLQINLCNISTSKLRSTAFLAVCYRIALLSIGSFPSLAHALIDPGRLYSLPEEGNTTVMSSIAKDTTVHLLKYSLMTCFESIGVIASC